MILGLVGGVFMAIVDASYKEYKQPIDRCSICEKEKSEGLHLYIGFICTECEREIVQTDTNEPVYQEFVKKLRKHNISGIHT